MPFWWAHPPTPAGVLSVNGAAGHVVLFADKLIEADNAEVLDSSDWPCVSAPATPDANNEGEIVRALDDTIEEGWGFTAWTPANCGSILFTITYWADLVPAATRIAGCRVYARRIAHNVALPAPGVAGWQSVNLDDLSIPDNGRPQHADRTVALTAWGGGGLVADAKYHFVISRPAPTGAGTELVDDLLLRSVRLRGAP